MTGRSENATPIQQRLRKLTLWVGIAIPVLAAMYLGAYYRMVRSVTIITIRDQYPLPVLQTEARYSFPWWIPAWFNQPALDAKLEAVFAPAHRIDRWLRPDVWFRREVAIQTQADGTGVIGPSPAPAVAREDMNNASRRRH